MFNLFSRYFSIRSHNIRKISSSRKDLIIVGGGVSGTSVLYNCSKLGLNGILLEKDKITSGTTWHSAGLHWNCRPNYYDIETGINTLKMIKNVEKDSGLSCGLIQNGGMYIANNNDRLNEYKRMSNLSKYYGIENYIITDKSDIKQIHPYLNTDDIVGCLYSPNDGTIDPDSITNCLARAAKNNGSIIKENTNVEKILIENNKIIGVQIDNNTIETDKLVLCTGSWTNLLNVKLPIFSFRHAFINTDTIENISKTPNVRDHDYSIYFKVQGSKLAIGGYEMNPINYEPNKNDSFMLFDLDYEHFMPLLENHIKRMPILEMTSLTDDICGPESFTPDHRCLIGEDLNIKGLYYNLGHNSMGITNSGLSLELSKLIVNGHTTEDLFHYDIKRYSSNLLSNSKYIKDTSWESYAKNYNIMFSNDQHTSGRNIVKDKLYNILLKKGAFYITNTSGYEIPYYYNKKLTSPLFIDNNYCNENSYKTDYYKELTKNYTFDIPHNFNIIRNEALHTRIETSLFNNSSFGKICVSGQDANKALQFLCTNNIKKNNKTTYTLMLNEEGTIEADITVSKINDNQFYINSSSLYTDYTVYWIKKQLNKYNFKNVEIQNISENYSVLSIAGRNSGNILQKLINQPLDLKFSHNKYYKIFNSQIFVIRLSFTGELGYELHIPNDKTEEIYNKIMFHHGIDYKLKLAGYAALDSLSAEKFYGHQGEEYTNKYTPIEANLDFVCKKKINYVGKNIIDKQRDNGVKTKLICISVDFNKYLHNNEIIYLNNIQVGFIKRSSFSHMLNKSIGFGYINYNNEIITNQLLDNGKFEIKILGEKYPCKLEKTPFDLENNRIKGIY